VQVRHGEGVASYTEGSPGRQAPQRSVDFERKSSPGAWTWPYHWRTGLRTPAGRRAGFRTYVVQEKRSSYKYDRDVVIGAELPSAGVTYYEVPAEYGVKDYRYTVVNDRTVLVDPRTHRIVQVIE